MIHSDLLKIQLMKLSKFKYKKFIRKLVTIMKMKVKVVTKKHQRKMTMKPIY